MSVYPLRSPPSVLWGPDGFNQGLPLKGGYPGGVTSSQPHYSGTHCGNISRPRSESSFSTHFLQIQEWVWPLYSPSPPNDLSEVGLSEALSPGCHEHLPQAAVYQAWCSGTLVASSGDVLSTEWGGRTDGIEV